MAGQLALGRYARHRSTFVPRYSSLDRSALARDVVRESRYVSSLGAGGDRRKHEAAEECCQSPDHQPFYISQPRMPSAGDPVRPQLTGAERIGRGHRPKPEGTAAQQASRQAARRAGRQATTRMHAQRGNSSADEYFIESDPRPAPLSPAQPVPASLDATAHFSGTAVPYNGLGAGVHLSSSPL